MKKFTNILLFLLLISSFQLLAQLDAGSYKFTDGELVMDLILIDGGETIQSVNIIKKGKTLIGSGEYRRSNGFGWYEFKTSECNYNFDISTGSIVLEEFDCKNGQKSIKYAMELVSDTSVSTWEGKYINGHGALLTIEGETELGVNYKLAYKGIDECEGLELSGTALFDGKNIAIGLNNLEYPVKIILNGDNLIFEPSCCDGDVGMKCLRYFDTEFSRK